MRRSDSTPASYEIFLREIYPASHTFLDHERWHFVELIEVRSKSEKTNQASVDIDKDSLSSVIRSEAAAKVEDREKQNPLRTHALPALGTGTLVVAVEEYATAGCRDLEWQRTSLLRIPSKVRLDFWGSDEDARFVQPGDRDSRYAFSACVDGFDTFVGIIPGPKAPSLGRINRLLLPLFELVRLS
ncbi:hypothetical protein BV25DRAFT_1922220 [Artomyces pyxidatus]|uniref:Uncharacterized protein n=1 Tax=Artomyces pyxidatus TaxID=48021 RepID=A0ACB8SFF8_9AGAM|nr:hypothetical protein BV25DRAFT_1922220 [Artomyces pyxidatus]